MPVYLEYDKTNGKVKRILTAETIPANVAYLAYQEIPEGIEIDMSLHIEEILKNIISLKRTKDNIKQQENNKIEEPEIIEV